MSRIRIVPIFLLAFTVAVAPAHSDEPPPRLLGGLARNFGRAFTGPRLWMQLGAIGATAALVPTGRDASIQSSFVWPGSSDTWAQPAAYLGYLLPVALGGGLYLAARSRDDCLLLRASYAGLQASLLAAGYVGVLKFFIGRPSPGADLGLNTDELSRTFRPGLGRGGIRDGWPSGHTAVTAALLSSIAEVYGDSAFWWVVSGAGTSYIAIGMTAANYHWFSDTVAGALFGYSIGTAVGAGFRPGSQAEGEAARPVAWLSPLLLEDGFGLKYSLALP